MTFSGEVDDGVHLVGESGEDGGAITDVAAHEMVARFV
jgi:hypothetical protein